MVLEPPEQIVRIIIYLERDFKLFVWLPGSKGSKLRVRCATNRIPRLSFVSDALSGGRRPEDSASARCCRFANPSGT